MAKKKAKVVEVPSFRCEVGGVMATVAVVSEGEAIVSANEVSESVALCLSQLAWNGLPLFPSSQFYGARSLSVFEVEGERLYNVTFRAKVLQQGV